MKRTQIKIIFLTTFLTLLLGACSDVLDEQPRSIYEPSFFRTEKGVDGGLTALYANLRNIYGHPYYYSFTETGTDEYTYAQSADNNFKDPDLSGVGSITPESSRSDVLWNRSFPNINTASGIIENATEVGTISEALIAEARFFRAFDYFILVQTFGGVPLDLGAGELKFNTSPARVSTRNTVPEVYTKAIFPDLLEAVNHLPDVGRVTGGVTKTAARLHLAKAYLTYGWWLENPNNIPTYPETPRVDPDGHDAQWYFQQAYNVAIEGIDNPGSFGLLDTYYDIHVGSNDRNKEIVLYADHTEASEFYNGSSLSFAGGPDGGANIAAWMGTWNYTVIRSSGVTSVDREADQHLGRPWTRMSPTIGVITNTFADKTNDSRFDGTFATVYRGNWDKAGNTTPTLINANGLPIAPGDAVLSILGEEPSTPITYPNGAGDSNVGAGVLPGRSDFVIGPNGISRVVYPGIWKLGTYRTDNSGGLGSPNGAITRPFNIAKFSELYFIAAEAAVKGASPQGGRSARDLINVIRARAGKWNWDNNGNTAKVEDNSAAMIADTPATIDIEYLLAERSREYYGEGYRWFDLVRTQKWNDLASTYKIAGTDYGDHTPQTITRTILPHHYLRPIPQGQLDGMEISEAESADYQNPGYN